ncbi:transposase and inactivated derivative, partial [Paenibacillus popilliae ATCC 14706]
CRPYAVMLNFIASPVYLACGATDMRKSIDGLSEGHLASWGGNNESAGKKKYPNP